MSLTYPALEPGALEQFRAAGRIARDARHLAVKLIRPGARLAEVMDQVESFIVEQGGGMAFPAQTSRNHIAAHYCPAPDDRTVYEAEDVVKVDIGVEVDGYVADNAQTVYLGEDPRYHKLIQASAAGLEAAIAAVGPGVEVREVSAAIEAAIHAHGYKPVTNLTGHGVARWKVHTAPQVPAIVDRWTRGRFEEGMVVAIEPFATDGQGPVHEAGKSEIFMLQKEPRKAKGLDPEVWAVIERMNGLPFARRTFAGLPAEAIEATLGRLRRTGCLVDFPPLVDGDPRVRIAQTEHTMVVTSDGAEVITA
ncbi:MAG: type II methionyl aminopeptidase [Planctomycetota bacterium]